MINVTENEKKFKEMAATIRRPGIDRLMAWLEKTDFFVAPSSTKYHGSERGGLCQHSLNVANRIVQLQDLYCPNKYPREVLYLVALFHDVCKCNCYYASTMNVKDPETGKWMTKPCFGWNEKDLYGGHGSKSVYFIQDCMHLNIDEAAAINCHMGFTKDNDMRAVSQVFEHNNLAFLLHSADMAATFIDEAKG